MLPEFFDHAQAENVGYLCVHRETGGQDVSILTQKDILKRKIVKKSSSTRDSGCCLWWK